MSNAQYDEKISFGEKFAYSLGDFSSNLILVFTGTLMSYFYTNVVGLPIAIVGTIMLVSRVFDALTNVIMGYIVDRTRSKYGKARPWILRCAIPFAISGILLVTMPADASVTFKTIYAFVTYNLATTVMYTAINIPYGVLNSLMTRDQYQRSVINIFRMTAANLGGLIIGSVTLPLIEMSGGEQKDWIVVMTAYAILAAVCFLICFKGTKERVAVADDENIPMKTGLKVMFQNKYWLLIAGIWLVMALSMAFAGMVTTYYCEYIVHDLAYQGLLWFVGSIPTILVIPFLGPFIKKFGKRNVSIIGMIITCIGQAGMLLGPADIMVLNITNVIIGVGLGLTTGTIFAMVADTIEYGEWKTGIRVEGLLYAAITFGATVGGGVGAALASYILAAAGFVENSTTQPESAITAIGFMFLIVPLIFCIIQTIMYGFYHLDKEYPQIMKDLEEREAQKQAAKAE